MTNKLFIFILGVAIQCVLLAQSPERISYQAVVRNTSNEVVSNQNIGIRVSILQGSATGSAVYVETQTPTSDDNGIIGIEIGGGMAVSGTLSTIDWANNSYFIKSEVDPNGGSNYLITGTSELLSVPYALHAKTAEFVLNDSVDDADNDPDNEDQVILAGNGVNVEQDGLNFTVTNAAPDQMVTLADGGSGNVTIGGTYPDFTIDVPGSASQSVLAGNGIEVNDTGLSVTVTNTAPDQTVTLTDGGSGGIQIGGTYPDFTIANLAPDQMVTLADGGNGNITIGGTYPDFTIDAPDNLDNDDTNELQTLSNVLIQGNDAGGAFILNTGTIGIGTDLPNVSSSIDASASGMPILFPNMTQADIDAISNPSYGMVAYNTDESKMQAYVTQSLPETNTLIEPEAGATIVSPGGTRSLEGNAAWFIPDSDGFVTQISVRVVSFDGPSPALQIREGLVEDCQFDGGGTLLGTSNGIVPTVDQYNTWTFPTPVAVSAGITYYIRSTPRITTNSMSNSSVSNYGFMQHTPGDCTNDATDLAIEITINHPASTQDAWVDLH